MFDLRWDDGLDDAQLAAATHGTDPLVVVAGAGTGKTRTLTSRVAHLLESFGALDKLDDFVSGFGRRFYKRVLESNGLRQQVRLRKVTGQKIDTRWTLGGQSVVPFGAGRELGWEICDDSDREVE